MTPKTHFLAGFDCHNSNLQHWLSCFPVNLIPLLQKAKRVLMMAINLNPDDPALRAMRFDDNISD